MCGLVMERPRYLEVLGCSPNRAAIGRKDSSFIKATGTNEAAGKGEISLCVDAKFPAPMPYLVVTYAVCPLSQRLLISPEKLC